MIRLTEAIGALFIAAEAATKKSFTCFYSEPVRPRQHPSSSAMQPAYQLREASIYNGHPGSLAAQIDRYRLPDVKETIVSDPISFHMRAPCSPFHRPLVGGGMPLTCGVLGQF